MWANTTSVSTRVASLSVFPVFNSVCTDHMTACLPQWANEPTPRRPFVVFPDINQFKVGVCRRIDILLSTLAIRFRTTRKWLTLFISPLRWWKEKPKTMMGNQISDCRITSSGELRNERLQSVRAMWHLGRAYCTLFRRPSVISTRAVMKHLTFKFSFWSAGLVLFHTIR